jgi:hypothetical protein
VLDHFATVTNRVASANHFTPTGRSLEGTCGVLSGLHLLPNPEMSHAGEIRAAQRFALLSLLTASLQCCGAAASRRRRLVRGQNLLREVRPKSRSRGTIFAGPVQSCAVALGGNSAEFCS